MATAAPNQSLPLFYNTVEPLSAAVHGKMKVRTMLRMPQVARTHAIPVTVDEFTLVQRHYPIVFSIGDNPIPIALMGLNEGVNVYLDADGRPLDSNVYVPAYVRRYPFLLARLRPDSDELSLCFDPTANAVGEFEEGQALFENDQPSEATKAILNFCEQFEASGQRTAALRRRADQGRPPDGRRGRNPARRVPSSRSFIVVFEWSMKKRSEICAVTSFES